MTTLKHYSYLFEIRSDNPDITLQKNANGFWIPAIPVPFYVIGMKKCNDCGRKFFTTSGYEGHYLLVHVLEVHV